MKFYKLILLVSIGVFARCENIEKKYILNTYGDKIEITEELNSGTFQLIDSTQRMKFINKRAKISNLEKQKILENNELEGIKQNETEINYDYSYYLDKEIVDVFVIQNLNQERKIVRKLKGQFLPIEADSELWER